MYVLRLSRDGHTAFWFMSITADLVEITTDKAEAPVMERIDAYRNMRLCRARGYWAMPERLTSGELLSHTLRI